MAYLQRVVNGGSPAGLATLEREYAIGSGRMDLCLRWPLRSGEVERFAVELKVWRNRERDPQEAGVEQLSGYLERLGLTSGHLLVFDRRSTAPPLPERISHSHVDRHERRLFVWRL